MIEGESKDVDVRRLETLARAERYADLWALLLEWCERRDRRSLNRPEVLAFVELAGERTGQSGLSVSFVQGSFMEGHLTPEEYLRSFHGVFS